MLGKYYRTNCPKCRHKLTENFRGEKICPWCIGQEMAKESIRKLKLSIPIEEAE